MKGGLFPCRNKYCLLYRTLSQCRIERVTGPLSAEVKQTCPQPVHLSVFAEAKNARICPSIASYTFMKLILFYFSHRCREYTNLGVYKFFTVILIAGLVKKRTCFLHFVEFMWKIVVHCDYTSNTGHSVSKVAERNDFDPASTSFLPYR